MSDQEKELLAFGGDVEEEPDGNAGIVEGKLLPRQHVLSDATKEPATDDDEAKADGDDEGGPAGGIEAVAQPGEELGQAQTMTDAQQAGAHAAFLAGPAADEPDAAGNDQHGQQQTPANPLQNMVQSFQVVAKNVAKQPDDGGPDDGSQDVVEDEKAGGHLVNAGNNRRKHPDHGNESGHNQRLGTMPAEKRLALLHPRPISMQPAQHARSVATPQRVADGVPRHRAHRAHGDHYFDGKGAMRSKRGHDQQHRFSRHR